MTTPGVPGPRPAPPPGAAAAAEAAALPELPDAEQLAAMSIREHVTLYEELHRTLADRLDDAES